MNERLEKLEELREFLNTDTENFSKASILEEYFFGSKSSGCKCKFNSVKSKLYQYYQANKSELDK